MVHTNFVFFFNSHHAIKIRPIDAALARMLDQNGGTAGVRCSGMYSKAICAAGATRFPGKAIDLILKYTTRILLDTPKRHCTREVTRPRKRQTQRSGAAGRRAEDGRAERRRRRRRGRRRG